MGALPTIWSLSIGRVDPDILFAGTRPSYGLGETAKGIWLAGGRSEG
jgi:hypothetical protein